MSASAEIREQAKRKKSKRGSVNNSNRLAAFASGEAEGGADWSECDASLMRDVVVGITSLGGAVLFGTSKDGGGHSLTLMLDKKNKTLWFNGDADLDVELQSVINTLSEMA